jgi:RND family efflux transporter MFP subunit
MKAPLLTLHSSKTYSEFCFIVVVFFTFFLIPSAAHEIETKTIKVDNIVKQISRTGKLGFKRTVSLSFKSIGYLKVLNIDEGDTFSKGQLLAELDAAELIEEKNASYARLLQAKREVTRILKLINKNLSSQQALDDARTAVDTARASYKVAEYNLTKARLYAPFDGVVVKRFSELGELQNPSQSTLKLAATHKNLVVRVALTAEEVTLISLQQNVDITFKQYGIFTGVVSKIPAIADQQNHLFTIEVLLSDVKATQVAVGQLARLSTKVRTNQLAYRLPIAALNSVDSQDRALIMLQENNALKATSFKQQAFVIKKISNKYIYLSAQENALPLTVVTKGWQQLNLNETTPAIEKLNKGI